jgi:8-oxo-dGTP pyrophosphatase MutT (NUDIX family)
MGDESALVAVVRRSVSGFSPVSGREVESRQRILEELDRLPRPFDRDADLVHITASGLVVGPRGTVLHVHRRLGRWLQPGGHVDRGEAPWDAALRETCEETGLTVGHPGNGPVLLHLDVHPAADDHVHLDLRYLLAAEDADPAPPVGESQQVRWWDLDEAMSVADEGLVDGLRRLQALGSMSSPGQR